MKGSSTNFYSTKNGIDPLLAGAGRALQNKIDPYYVTELRNFLFGRLPDPKDISHISPESINRNVNRDRDPRINSKRSRASDVPLGTDLAARNIQRGRDHGLPRYNDMREYFGLRRIFNFSEITSDEELQTALLEVYETPDNVDPYIGGLAEGVYLTSFHSFHPLWRSNFLQIPYFHHS